MGYGGLSPYASWKSDSAIHVAVLGMNFRMYDFWQPSYHWLEFIYVPTNM